MTTARRHWNSHRYDLGDRVKFYFGRESWIGYVTMQSNKEVRAYFPTLGERHFTWRGTSGTFVLRAFTRGLLSPTTEKNMYTVQNFKTKKALKEAVASSVIKSSTPTTEQTMYTAKEYRAEVMKAIVAVRNVMLEDVQDESPADARLRNVYLQYASDALHTARALVEPKDQTLPSSQIAFRKWVGNPDPDTAIFNFSDEQRRHIRDGSYTNLKHNCGICLSIDRAVYR